MILGYPVVLSINKIIKARVWQTMAMNRLLSKGIIVVIFVYIRFIRKRFSTKTKLKKTKVDGFSPCEAIFSDSSFCKARKCKARKFEPFCILIFHFYFTLFWSSDQIIWYNDSPAEEANRSRNKEQQWETYEFQSFILTVNFHFLSRWPFENGFFQHRSVSDPRLLSVFVLIGTHQYSENP